MATPRPAAHGIEEITERIKKFKFSKDDSETQITVCTWNTNGKANPGLRKRVLTDTFNPQQYQEGTRLGQSDIICVQEMTTNPEMATTQQYLPFARDYGVVPSEEPGGKIYNAVYFNKDKFSQVADGCLTRAYNLMAIKKRCYDYIQQGGEYTKKLAIKGQLNYPWGQNASTDERLMFQEVLSECREAGSLQGFNWKISKFRAPGELQTKDPFILLKRRMAMCVLEIKSLQEKQNNIIHVVVASVHNYSSRSGVAARESYASLLFDFLSKLPHNLTVIIAGDFNFDILAYRDQYLTQYFPSYYIPMYELRPLRNGLRIDFIVVTKSKADAKLQVSVSEVQAHDLLVAKEIAKEVDDEITKDPRKKIADHNPVSAVIELKLR
jgi:exonuclease III